MEIIWTRKIDKILDTGQFLTEVGVNNWALTKLQALIALDALLAAKIPVLGGDVYENIEGIIQSNYDNWFCELEPGENKDIFLIKSITKAQAYIEKYKSVHPPDKIFFAITPGEV